MESVEHEVKELLAENQQILINFANQYLNNLHDAQDVVQSAFIKFINFRNQGKVDQPLSWLYRVIRNLAIDYLRRRKVRDKWSGKEFLNLQETTTDVTPKKSILASEDAEMIRRCIAEFLNEKESIIVNLKYFQHLSYIEIAARTGISVNNVGVTLCNALKKLKRNFDRD